MADTTHTIRIRVDTSGVRQGTQETQNALQQVERSADKASQQVGLVGRAFANLKSQILNVNSAVAGFSAGFAAISAVNVLAGFEDKMADVRAVTLATDADFKTLRDTALDLGSNTRFTATQAAEGLELLGRAGASAGESMKLIKTTLQLAQAENLSLADSAETVVKVISQMRLSLDDANRVANLLSATASKTTTDVKELGVAFRYGAVTAAGFKVPIEEVSAALGVLAQNGQTGSLGGTAFRGIISRLADPTKEFLKELKNLKIEYNEVNPKSVAFIDILERFKKAGVDASSAFALFAQRGGPAFEILVNNIEPLKKLKGELFSVGDLLNTKFQIKADTLLADIKSALSAVQSLIFALGDAGLTAALRLAFQAAAATFRGLADGIRALVPLAQNAAIAFALVFSRSLAIGFLTMLAQINVALVVLTATALRAAAAMAAFLIANPAFAFLAGLTAVITLVRSFASELRIVSTQAATVADVFEAVMNRVKAAAVNAVNSVIKRFRDMIQSIKFGLESLLDSDRSAQIDRLRRFQTLQEQFNSTRSRLAPQSGGIFAEANEIALIRHEEQVGAALRETHAELLKNTKAKKEGKVATDGLSDATRKLTEDQRRERDLLRDIFGAQKDARANIETINQLYSGGLLSLSQYNDELQRQRDLLLKNDQTLSGGVLKGLNGVAEGATRFGDKVAGVIQNAFSSASDAIADFATTGKFSFQDLANSILKDMARLAANRIFGSLVNGLLGGIGGPALAGTGSLGSGFDLGGFFGFATGGSFRVGGSGGTDSSLVAFRATPGEMVDVRTPGQAAGRGGSTVVNVYNENGGQVRTETRQTPGGGEQIDVYIERAVNQKIANGAFDGSMRGRYGTANTLVRR